MVEEGKTHLTRKYSGIIQSDQVRSATVWGSGF